ncbi:Tetratricopeptide-like helical domain containing protein [Trema orientale]|uniref:Tetratricopeptide-like helical domain containing protein n=1 Tax=Trema orientale TaxID=63057 RepID=A0A2P5EE42_TREOI|nr:Tetratricopeptide-like helical domain containing protein [Trema orientale]
MRLYPRNGNGNRIQSTLLVKINHKQHECILEKLGKCSDLNHLKQLQAFLITIGHSQTQLYAFKLVRFTALALADLSYARSIFDRLCSPNVYLFAAMITAYASQCRPISAFDLYRYMLRRGTPSPNHFIYPQVLKSCPNATALVMVHTHILKSGFGRNPIVQTALTDSYAKFSLDVASARQMFDEMSERNRNVVTWTAMISGYIRLGDIENALLLFEKMPDRDVPSWNALIAGCTQNGFFQQAISLFKRMIFSVQEGKDHIRPNHVTVASTLSACGHSGMLQLGKWIHGYVYRNGLLPDSFLSNALVDMYGKCGNLNEARRIFDMTSPKCLTSWNSMINCYALHGQSESSITIFQEMIKCKDDVSPNEITFIGLFNACTHGGLVEEGIAYFDMMTKVYEIKPQIEHYGCLIDLLGRAGRFDEAMEVVRGMEMEPDEVVWGSLLNGCKIYRRTDLAEIAVQKLMEIDPHNNGGYASMLANIYGELEKWDEVRKVRRMLKYQNTYKTPGCSWIEVNEQVFQFHSADTAHPRTEEIYSILESLVGFISFKSS